MPRWLAGLLPVLAVVVLLAVVGVFSSGPAQAQSVSSPTIWEATLTAGLIEGFGGWGYSRTFTSGSLTSAEFELEGTTYRINQLRRSTNTTVPTDVSLTLDSALPAGDFQLRIGAPATDAAVLNFSAADNSVRSNNYKWSNVRLPGLA